jgi:hypothetical protein
MEGAEVTKAHSWVNYGRDPSSNIQLGLEPPIPYRPHTERKIIHHRRILVFASWLSILFFFNYIFPYSGAADLFAL